MILPSSSTVLAGWRSFSMSVVVAKRWQVWTVLSFTLLYRIFGGFFPHEVNHL